MKRNFKVLLIKSGEKRKRFRFILEPLEEVGYDVEVLDRSKVFSMSARLFKLFICNESDEFLVITLGAGLSVLPAQIISKIFKVKFILRVGGSPLRNSKTKLKARMKKADVFGIISNYLQFYSKRYILKNANALITVSQSIEAELKADLKQNSPIFVVPQFCVGIAKPKEALVKSNYQVVTVTNLSYREKADGVIWLISTLSKYCEKYQKPLDFFIAGGGEQYEYLSSHEVLSNCSNLLSVTLCGFVENIDEVYEGADVFVYNSSLDGTPNVLLEAKRHGLPVLANNIPQFDEVLDGGASGFLYDSEIQFVELFSQLLESPSDRFKLSKSAVQDHEARYSLSAVARNLKKVIEQVVE